MMESLILLVLIFGAAIAVPASDRIVGGQPTTVVSYPEIASLARSSILSMYIHACGGTILTSRAIMTAAHCIYGNAPQNWRARVGSSYHNTGGFVYTISSIITHPQYMRSLDNDIGILRPTVPIAFVATVQPASIPSANFVLRDNSSVVAAGWGSTTDEGPLVSQLRHVQLFTVNQNICTILYRSRSMVVTDNMLCAGWLGTGGKDTCNGDSGGPLYYGRVVVGITSWGIDCASPTYPGVSTRVSKYTTWLQSTA